MGLTRNLRRIGMAAHNERLETQRWIEEMNRKSAERRHMICMDVSQEIRDTMTQEEYDAWWEAAPEDGFIEYAEDYLLAIKGKTNHYNNVINGTAKMTPAYRAQLHAEYNARFTH